MLTQDALKFAQYIAEQGFVLYGNRIGVVRDEDDGTYGKGLIVKPDQNKKAPKRGTVVMIGLGIDAEDKDMPGLAEGDRVLVNVYNTLQILMPNAEGDKVKIDVFHANDIYIGRKAAADAVDMGLEIE